MLIRYNPLRNTNNLYNNKKDCLNNNYTVTLNRNSLLKNDCFVSFTSMKKSQFAGVDFAAVEKYKAPIEKFNSNNDLQNWADNECDKIINKDYSGKYINTLLQRKRFLNEWNEYLIGENLKPVEKLIVLKGITKDLSGNNASIPPILNKKVFSDTISELNKNLENDRYYQFDFGKMYKNNLKTFYIKGTEYSKNDTKWIVIPSKQHDREHFSENVEKLKTVSPNGWCTKDNHAEVYLSTGDFHIYIEKGEPKLGVKFDDDLITEVQGRFNNNRITPKYFEILKEYVKTNDYQIANRAVVIFNISERIKDKVEKIDKELGKSIKNNDKEKIFNYFGMDVSYDKDGGIILSEYKTPEGLYFSDIGIDENKLFNDVVEIKGTADFQGSELTTTNRLKKIGGNAIFSLSKIKSLDNLETVKGNVVLTNSRIKDSGALVEVGGNLNAKESKLERINKIKTVGGNLDMRQSSIIDIGELEEVGNNFYSSPFLSNLKKLKVINGNASFRDSANMLRSLGALKSVGGNADFTGVKLNSTDNLEEILGDAIFVNTKIQSLNKLEFIGGDADFTRAEIDNIDNLKYIGGRIIAPKYSITDNLREQLKNTNQSEQEEQKKETDTTSTIQDFLNKIFDL